MIYHSIDRFFSFQTVLDMLCHLLTKLELTASASMAQRLTDDCVSQWVSNVEGASRESRVLHPYKCNNVCVYMCSRP